jgi:glycine cleavage system transcriptional repressor
MLPSPVTTTHGGTTVSHEKITYIVSILCPDRSGIIADVSETIYQLGGNLIAMSQTIMQGWFTMLVSAEFPPEVPQEDIERRLSEPGRFDVLVRNVGNDTTAPQAAGEPFIITSIGQDKPGIVRRLSRCCAAKGVNITDVWNEINDGRFITIFHVTVPRDIDPKNLRYDLEIAARELDVVLTFQHQDIFTATSSLQVHTKRPS